MSVVFRFRHSGPPFDAPSGQFVLKGSAMIPFAKRFRPAPPSFTYTV